MEELNSECIWHLLFSAVTFVDHSVIDYSYYDKESKVSPEDHIRSHFFSQCAVNDWNQLRDDVVDAVSLNAFKTRLDDHWTDHPEMFDFKVPADVK